MIAYHGREGTFSWSIVVVFAAVGVLVALVWSSYSQNHSGHGSSSNRSTDELYLLAAETSDSPQSFAEMTERTDAVVRGQVIAVNPGRVLDTLGEPSVQIVDVTLQVAGTLSGVAESGQVAIEWMAWSQSHESTDRRLIVLDGLHTPVVGEEMVWFVIRTDGFAGDVPRYGLVSLDGIFSVSNGRIVSTLEAAESGPPRLAVRSSGSKIEDLAREIGR